VASSNRQFNVRHFGDRGLGGMIVVHVLLKYSLAKWIIPRKDLTKYIRKTECLHKKHRENYPITYTICASVGFVHLPISAI
jgi:hypothetical protein